jgi:hypothetical protein
VWSSITDKSLRAISSRLPYLTALFLPTANSNPYVRGGISKQAIRECRAALRQLRCLYVKPGNEFVRCPESDDDDVQHECKWYAEDD